jgi:hypothetical protein
MDRRTMISRSAAALGAALTASPAVSAAAPAPAPSTNTSTSIEQWDRYEVTLHGPSTGNPFTDVQVSATFTLGHRDVEVTGFYDGAGVYKVRYMPDAPGRWTWRSSSSIPELNGHSGAFEVTKATGNNHGPVTTAHQYHFQHADGTPYFPFGTTCYAMAFMGEPWEQDTIDTLRTAGFNKVRLCLLPKPLGHELFALPFEKHPDGSNDLTRLNPAYFQHCERRIQDLSDLGIQADVILFHPYDAWGYKSMPAEANDLYLKYAVARLASFRNVWWSVANEYDLVKSKTMPEWDHYFHVIQQYDPSSHLRSIHHSRVQYDNSKPWVTHASLQEYDFNKAPEYRAAWGKPILWDEIQYEGNFSRRWGNLSAEEMTRRFWLAVIAGTYATHGDTFNQPKGVPVWSDGGKLSGTSAPRIKFLREVVEKITKVGLNEFEGAYYLSAGTPNQLYLYYFDFHQPAEYDFPLPQGVEFKATLIDPWNMTMTPLPGTIKAVGKQKVTTDEGEATTASSTRVALPGKPYQAIVFEKV